MSATMSGNVETKPGTAVLPREGTQISARIGQASSCAVSPGFIGSIGTSRVKKTVAQPRTVAHQMANGDRPHSRLGLGPTMSRRDAAHGGSQAAE